MPTTPPPDDDDFARRRARHAAQQHAAAAILLLQEVGAHLHRDLAGDLAHGREQWQRPIVELDGLVGDADDLALEEGLGELGRRRQMKVGEQHLACAQQRELLGQRLFDLDDHLSFGEDGLRGRAELRPGGKVLRIGDARPLACRALDDHLVAVLDQVFHAGRDHGHPVLVVLDFLWHADDHFVPRARFGFKRTDNITLILLTISHVNWRINTYFAGEPRCARQRRVVIHSYKPMHAICYCVS